MSAFSNLILDPNEAPLTAADLDWTVSKRPIYTRDHQRNTLNKVPKTYSLTRDDTGEHISVVSDRYEPTQNHQTVDFFEQYTHHAKGAITHGGHWENKSLALFAELPLTTSPGSDHHEQQFYLLARSGHQPGQALRILLTSIRTVCTNQFNITSYDNKGFFYQWHNTAFDSNAQNAARHTLDTAKTFIENYRQQLQFMITRRIDQVPEFLNSLFDAQPNKAPPKITQVINNNFRDNTWIGATDETAKTRYALWNCITEAIDHTARGWGKSALIGKGQTTKHTAFNALLTA